MFRILQNEKPCLPVLHARALLQAMQQVPNQVLLLCQGFERRRQGRKLRGGRSQYNNMSFHQRTTIATYPIYNKHYTNLDYGETGLLLPSCKS